MCILEKKYRLAVYKHFWSPIFSFVSRCDILDFVIIFFCNGSMSDKLRCHDTTKDLVYLSILFWCMWANTWTVIWYHDNQYTSACAEQWRLHDFVIGGALVSLIYVNAALLYWSSYPYSTSTLHLYVFVVDTFCYYIPIQRYHFIGISGWDSF